MRSGMNPGHSAERRTRRSSSRTPPRALDVIQLGAVHKADDLPELLRAAADALEDLAAHTTAGRWTVHGPSATRPDVIAHYADGTTEVAANARTRTAHWISTMSPAVAPHLARWLRYAADQGAGLDTRIAASALGLAAEILAKRT